MPYSGRFFAILVLWEITRKFPTHRPIPWPHPPHNRIFLFLILIGLFPPFRPIQRKHPHLFNRHRPIQSNLSLNHRFKAIKFFEATASADVIPPADSEATASGSIDSSPPVPQSPQPPQVPQQSDVQAPAASPVLTEPQSPPVSIPVDPPKESDIQEPAPSNQPSQVQPEAPKDMPVVQVENTPPQSAGIKPEPPQGTKNIPSADIKIPETPKSSFGDLMGKPSDLSVEPAIHIDPIEAPTTPPVTPTSPPIVTPPPQPTEENQQAALALRRQHAIQARKQKRDENLDQILELAQRKVPSRISTFVTFSIFPKLLQPTTCVPSSILEN